MIESLGSSLSLFSLRTDRPFRGARITTVAREPRRMAHKQISFETFLPTARAVKGVGFPGNHTNAFYRVIHGLAKSYEFLNLVPVGAWEG